MKTRHVGSSKQAFRARLPQFFTLCSSKIDVFPRVFLTDPKSSYLIKGPDYPTSQLLPIMSSKCCSGDGEGRKDKGGGGGSRSRKVVCEELCVTKLYVKDGVLQVTKKDGACGSCVWKGGCDKVVCNRWCVTKLCVTKLCVTKLCVTKRHPCHAKRR